jgi:hypothetical protein
VLIQPSIDEAGTQNDISNAIPEAQDSLGQVLAAGDFDADGYTDLAEGAPNYSAQATNGGRVVIHYGSSQGLASADSLDQGSEAAQDEFFGASLSVGDFDADGVADLVIGVPGESSIAGLRSKSDSPIAHDAVKRA